MQPMRRHLETGGLRPDVACEVSAAFILRCAEFSRPRAILRLAAARETPCCSAMTRELAEPQRTSSAAAATAPSAGTGERGFVEQRERCAVRHTAANTLQFEF